MRKIIAVLPGDGIGPEVVNQGIKVMTKINQRFGHEFELKTGSIGANSINECGIPLKEEVIEMCEQADAILLGAIGDPKFDNDPACKIRPEQGLLQLRKALSLHTNIRPITTYRATKHASPLKNSILKDVDFVIYRELTGGLYFGKKHLSDDGEIASDSCSYTKTEITRIAHHAFQMAQTRKRKLTLVDKANVLETSRLWRTVIREMSSSYPEITVDYLYVDNAAMQLMLNPAQFDVILTENLFGDILSDLASVITGSIGMLPSASIGNSTALFEPVHGSYPQAAGKDIANPMGTILSIAMLYDYFGLTEEANTIREAISWAINSGIHTPDIHSTKYSWCSRVGDLISFYVEDPSSVHKSTCIKESEVLI